MTGTDVLAWLSAPATAAAATALFKAGRLTQKVNGLEKQLSMIETKIDRLIFRLLDER